MSYSDWMTKTAEDIMFADVLEADQEYAESGKPPLNGDARVASCSTERERENWVGPSKAGDSQGCANHQQLRNSTSFESINSQFTRSSISEDSLGLMEQVVRIDINLLNSHCMLLTTMLSVLDTALTLTLCF